ncbi:HHE domain-containing protein [Bimuria novae-zelandiae CBS 107.79]|uniref:HHE domain-containing protein n=1 Tax=Bimuria novae-zelandiae CBS 107.79 TaxID=1447943 RepID=A0A6A5VQD5_9PLEO|nr:HHE domain-containing protein [Bimuria novae-zelandiae CBS 107.79]
MFAARNFAVPVARAACRPQAVVAPANARLASLRAHIAALSTVSEPIIHDHKELKQFYNEVVNNSNDHDHQDRYGNQFTWELARHSIAEELVIYPAFEKYLGQEGKNMAESDRKQHHQVKEHLKKFQNLKASHPDYVPELKSLWAILEKHIQEEEQNDLPKFEKVLSQHEEASTKLAVNFQRVKAFIPTRSHPSAGENPYFESLAGLLAAPMDKLADLFRKFPEK